MNDDGPGATPKVTPRQHTHRRPVASTWGKTIAAAGIGTVAGVIAMAGYSLLAEESQPSPLMRRV